MSWTRLDHIWGGEMAGGVGRRRFLGQGPIDFAAADCLIVLQRHEGVGVYTLINTHQQTILLYWLFKPQVFVLLQQLFVSVDLRCGEAM